MLVPKPAHAILLYLEGSGGLSFFMTATPTFPTMTGGSSSLGSSWTGGLMLAVTNGGGPFDFHIGGKFRSTAGNTFAPTWTNYQMLSAYPEMKFQISIFYLSVGITPFMWSRESTQNWGIDNLQTLSGKFNFIGEFGIMYAWTPYFTIGLSGTAEIVTNGFFGAPIGPMPAVTANLFMRFYLWRQDIAAGTAPKPTSVDPAEYKGWRYPGGWLK